MAKHGPLLDLTKLNNNELKIVATYFNREKYDPMRKVNDLLMSRINDAKHRSTNTVIECLRMVGVDDEKK